MSGPSTPRFPAPGKLYQVAGHSMHIHSTGQGTPTVVLEAGGASWSLDWHLVQERVASFTRVCSYDRAGFGWSDPGPRPRHAQAMADELAALLHASQNRGPYILVGASFGGHIARLFAARNRSDTVAVVLLDARHEDIDSRLPASWRRLERTAAAAQRVMLFLSRARLLGMVARLGGERAIPPAVKKLPAEIRDAYLAVGFRPKYFEANLAELESIALSDDQVRSAGRLGDIPLSVVHHGVAGLFSGLPREDAELAEVSWQNLQRDLAALSSCSRVIAALRSGHAIQLDQPELVVETIRERVMRFRNAR